MGQKFNIPWEIIKAGAKVLNSDKGLLLFPILLTV